MSANKQAERVRLKKRYCGHRTVSGCKSCGQCFACCCTGSRQKLNAALTRAVDIDGAASSYEEAIDALRHQIKFLKQDRRANFGEQRHG